MREREMEGAWGALVMISFSLESAGKMGATKRTEMEDRRGQAPFMTFWILFKDVLMWRSLKNFAQNFTFDNRDSITSDLPQRGVV